MRMGTLGNNSAEIDTPRDVVGLDGRARKNTEIILQSMRATTLGAIAKYSGISDSTLSRWLSENIVGLGKVLAFLGLKVVPMTMFCVSERKYLAYEALAEEHFLAVRARRAREQAFEQTLHEDVE